MRRAEAAAERVACRRCCMRPFCDQEPSGSLRSRVIKLRRGEQLFATGDACRELYAVQSGAFKSALIDPEGREVVCGFRLPGDMLGLEGIADGRHACDVAALSDSEVCVLPYAQLAAVAGRELLVQRELIRMLAVELRDRQAMGLALATQGAEQRVAAFLADLSRRYAERGLDGARLRLPMPRTDIAAYLALTPETVSRALTKLETEGAIRVSARSVAILDAAALARSATSRRLDSSQKGAASCP